MIRFLFPEIFLILGTAVILFLYSLIPNAEASPPPPPPAYSMPSADCGALNMVTKCVMDDGTVCYLANNGRSLSLQCRFE